MKTNKKYVPVGNFERHTSHCPTYLAWQVLDEARDYFRKPIPESYAATLARRAEAVLAHQPFWEKKYQSRSGRDYLLMSMRHWLASVLAKERPALFRELPESFKIGHPLPLPRSRVKTLRRIPRASRPVRAFVHGSELLA